MFGLFKKKSEVEKLEERRKKLLEASFNLSKTDRTAADAKFAEAENLSKEIDRLNKENTQ
jgi:hypothetical protein